MKLNNKIMLILLLILTLSCTQFSELPFPGPGDVHVGDEPVTVRIYTGQEVIIDNKIKIGFEGVGADSRCPVDVRCVWAGDGEVFLNISKGHSSMSCTLHTTLEPRDTVIDNYLIQLVRLFPETRTDRKISQHEYSIELRITNLSGNSLNSVQLIEASQNVVLKKDMLNVTEVSMDKDLLNITVGYSGGCRDHLIELFALKEIEKSNPAKVTLYISHFANGDMCEAYVTRKMQFDLTQLKQFLKSNYNITDRVTLIIYDTSGRPLKNPSVDYTF